MTLPIAFGAAKHVMKRRDENLERVVRTRAAELPTSSQVVSRLIDNIKTLLGPSDLFASGSEAKAPDSVPEGDERKEA